jgi:ABC-2 type transport system ATP-binding protein
MEVLRVESLSKHYGPIKALDGLSFTVQQGQIMGLLGPNGSGKTTTLGIILGILNQTSGSYTWFENKYNDNHRLHIGSILETPNFYPYLNADDNLNIIRQIKGVDNKNFDELLELVKLAGRRKSTFSSYSLGMKQRLAIAATLIGNPQIVIFDEPTNGLDPEGIAEVRSILKEIASRGRTVIMASHILDEVEKICSHVTIIKKGKLLSSGPVGAIINDNITIEIGSENNAALMEFLNAYPGINSINRTDNNHLECTADKEIIIAEINSAAIKSGIRINHLVSRKRRLEEEFLEIVNQQNN